MKTQFIWFAILFISFGSSLKAQEYSYRGYVKHLSALTSGNSIESARYSGIIHHRLENTITLEEIFTFKADFRNRIFYGNQVDDYGIAASALGMDPGIVDLTFVPFENKSLISQIIIDRLQFNANWNSWDVTIGRQRINWGKSFVWSPNDLFNTFAFLDFDYEERPGSDAVSAIYSYGFASDIQLAYKPGKTYKDWVAAGMWRTNIESISYDIQLLSGVYKQDVVLGAGWAGYIKDAGFSGEISVFNPFSEVSFSVSSGFDYLFSNGLYSRVEWLYNGGYEANSISSSLFAPPSPKNLFPSKQAVFGTMSFNITPLFQGSFGVISSLNSTIQAVVPQLTYSATQNVDILLVGQLFMGDLLDAAPNQKNSFYFRLKWSY